MKYNKTEVFNLFKEILNTYRKESKYAFWVKRSTNLFSKTGIYFDIVYGFDTQNNNRYRLAFYKSENHNGVQVLPSEIEIEISTINATDVGTLAYETDVLSIVLGRLQKELKIRGVTIEDN